VGFAVTSPDITTRRAVEAVWRIESARITAGLARLVQDVGLAEELAQDAFVAALEQWPARGVPENPGAWLMSTAKHRAVDHLRRHTNYQSKLALLANSTVEATEPSYADLDDYIGDDLLRLIFTACHPVLSTEGRVALTLRILGGLATDEIARGFLVPEPTVAQRIVRAKRSLVGVPIEMPAREELPDRLASVLEVVYLIFNEGYSATAGGDWMRPALCGEALRLGRVLAGLMPATAEVHGLVALMEFQASRLGARSGPDGEPILLPDQDRRRWDRLLIRRGLAALDLAESLGGGPYTLQAAIAACHARASSISDTDWVRMSTLYDDLAAVWPTPVVELNRAVAVGMAFGPAAGLSVMDGISLPNYPHFHAVRGDLLARLSRSTDAREAFEQAAALTRNEAERSLFLGRAAGANGIIAG
jgi:RNA polymerase sigma factor (sigma-70 family)